MPKEDTQFKPGQSGNPAGRPVGTLSLVSLIKSKLGEAHPEDGETYAKKLIGKYINEALENNDGQAIRDLVDRIDGKAMQNMNLTNENDSAWLKIFKDIKNETDNEATDDTET